MVNAASKAVAGGASCQNCDRAPIILSGRCINCRSDMPPQGYLILSPGFFQQVAGRELPGYVASAVQNVFVHVDENQYGSVY